ncbi:MAG: hypothetical protein ACREBG_28525 [Pyrinomonadaceae bacterium]
MVGNFSEAIGVYMLIALSSYAYSYYRSYREGQVRTVQLEAQLSHAQLPRAPLDAAGPEP